MNGINIYLYINVKGTLFNVWIINSLYREIVLVGDKQQRAVSKVWRLNMIRKLGEGSNDATAKKRCFNNRSETIIWLHSRIRENSLNYAVSNTWTYFKANINKFDSINVFWKFFVYCNNAIHDSGRLDESEGKSINSQWKTV